MDSNSADINLNAASLVLDFYTKIIDRVIQTGQALLEGKAKNTVVGIKSFFAFSGEVYHLDMHLCNAMFRPQDEIFYLPQDDPRWVKLREHYEFVDYGDAAVKVTVDNMKLIDAFMAATTHV